MAKRPDDFAGMDLTSPINRVPPGRVTIAENVRAYLNGGFKNRHPLSDPILTIDSSVQSLARLNDTTPAGPIDGFVIISESASGKVFSDLANVASGLSGNPVSLIPFRPNTSVQPWMYIGDDAPYPNVTVDSSFHCTGMIKVRSDGLSRKMGIAEPQAAPTVAFPGGGTGPSQIFYYYTYYASETGAESNPSPVSIPGTNSQSNPSKTVTANDHATKLTFNATQYEYLALGPDGQIRTKGGVAPGTVTDFVVAKNFGFAIPSNVTIDGIQADLYWQGQNAGTGVLSAASLYYLGGPLGTPKFPGIQNQSFATDTLIGSNGDKWGATLTPDIVNDASFGFGVQITTQLSGGSDRSFMYHWVITVYYSTQNADITPVPSPDPQVDKINYYRQGGGLANPTFVGQGPNAATMFNDTLSDLGAATNRELVFYNFEPVPSIDLPRSGILNASGQVLTAISGDSFNTRWLPGTVILIGVPNQIAYTAPRRPASSSSWDMTNNDPNVPTIPDGVGLRWNIAEPILAAQPLAYLWGPTDNINYVFGVGDPNRPGTLYWCTGSNLDSWPDTNQMDVTDPSEALVNGAMSGGLGVLFSIRRAWIILPNFFNALATVTGTVGSTWTLQATYITRGLFMPRCLAVAGGGKIFFRVDDGIHFSEYGMASISITDEDLYPLFPHESSGTGSNSPVPVVRNGVTIYPPDDSRPQDQKFSVQNGYLYYDYAYAFEGSETASIEFSPESITSEGDGIQWNEPQDAVPGGIGVMDPATISGFSITSNIVTFSTVLQFSQLVAGQDVVISSMQFGTYLNGQTLKVLPTGLTSTSFQATFVHADVASTVDSGFATPTTAFTYAQTPEIIPLGPGQYVLYTQPTMGGNFASTSGNAFSWSWARACQANASNGWASGHGGWSFSANINSSTGPVAIPTMPAGAVIQGIYPLVNGFRSSDGGGGRDILALSPFISGGQYNFSIFVTGWELAPSIGTDLTRLSTLTFEVAASGSSLGDYFYLAYAYWWGAAIVYTLPDGGTPADPGQLQTLHATVTGISLPPSTVVTGVKVSFSDGTIIAGDANLYARLTISGTQVGSAKPFASDAWATPDSLGGASDLWGQSSMTGAQANNLGVDFYGTMVPEEQINLNELKLTVYYETPSSAHGNATLVFDAQAGGWIWDAYSHAATIHGSNEGESIQGTLVGCLDGSIRHLEPSGTETVTGTLLTAAIGGTGWMTAYEYTVEYKSNAPVSLTSIAADNGNGSYASAPVTLASTGGNMTKYTFKISPNKWKLMWLQFQSTDQQMEIYLEGFVIQAKPWGANSPFVPIQPFAPNGGTGAQINQ